MWPVSTEATSSRALRDLEAVKDVNGAYAFPDCFRKQNRLRQALSAVRLPDLHKRGALEGTKSINLTIRYTI